MSDWDWDWLLKGSGLQPQDFMPKALSSAPEPDDDSGAAQLPSSAYGEPAPLGNPGAYDYQAAAQLPAIGAAQPGIGEANGYAQRSADTGPETPARLTTSSAGVQFIQNEEGGYQNGIYSDPTENPTFGWGHKLTPDEASSLNAALPNMTEDQKLLLATGFLHTDLQNAEQIVHHKLGPAVRSLSQNQFDALVSDAFNAGYNGALGKTMVGAIRSGNFPAAGQQFNAYHGTVNGQRTKIDGLVRRNKNEAALFNNGDYSRPFGK